MKIALVVHGRFHAFDLARAMDDRGNQVTVFTNYPVWATRRFNLGTCRVRSFWIHGVLSRLIERLLGVSAAQKISPVLHRLFGRWTAKRLATEEWDLVHAFTGIAEEALEDQSGRTLHFIVRGSAHIRVQDELLRQEAVRSGIDVERPTPWMIAREEREYATSDKIAVLSTFARDSFIRQGTDPAKLILLPLGVDVRRFRPAPSVLEERCRRIRAGEPLTVLFTGNLTLQKGLFDLIRITQALRNENFVFRVVGTVPSESAPLMPQLPPGVDLIPRQPQNSLPKWYAEADLYIFPTIQDGFAAVLAQAGASALPILTTTNCAGPDIIQNDESGWVMPIRDPDAFVRRLRWCDAHREEVAEMVMRIHTLFQPREWTDVAADLERAYEAARVATQIQWKKATSSPTC